MTYHQSKWGFTPFGSEEKSVSIIFLQAADFAVLFHGVSMYKKMGKTFIVRDADRLFEVVWNHDRGHGTDWTREHQALCGLGPHEKLWAGPQPVWLAPNYLKQQGEFFSLALASSGPKANAVTRAQSSQTPHIKEKISLHDTGSLPKTHRHKKRRHNFLSPFGQY